MNLLYYPQILVPIKDLKKYVLYGNTISTIVPDEFQFDYGEDLDFNESLAAILELERLGVYKKSYASEILSTHKKEIHHEFNKRLQVSESYKMVQKGTKPSVWWKLYLSKMDHDLRQILIENQLAERGNDKLFYVEADSASIYMGLLAEYSSLYGENFYSTVTDRVHYKDLVYKPIDDVFLKTKFTLTDILPVPEEKTSVHDILEFKESRKNELARFQEFLSKFEEELLGITDIREYRAKLNHIERKIKVSSEDLKTLLKEHKITCVTNTMDKVINFIPKVMQKIFSDEGIIKVTPIVEKLMESDKIHRNSEVSYLVRAESAGIVK